MPKHNFKRLNVAQKAERKKSRVERRGQIKQKRQDQLFCVKNLIARPSTKGKPLRFLVLGDGDFSFSSALHRQLNNQCPSSNKIGSTSKSSHRGSGRVDNGDGKGGGGKGNGDDDDDDDEHQLRRKFILVATSYDSKEEVVSKYPTTSTNHLRSLGAIGKKRKRRKSGSKSGDGNTSSSSSSSSSAPDTIRMTSGPIGTVCLHNVDATHIVDSLSAHSKFSISSLPKVYDRIIWNFPHTGEQRVHLNRNIIRDFMEHAATCLSSNGVVYVTLNWKPPYSLWDINTLFPTDQLEAIGYLKFSPDAWSGYEHQTTLGRPGGATPVQEGIDGARTYMFKLAAGKKSLETREEIEAELLKRKQARDREQAKDAAGGSKRAKIEGQVDSSTPAGVLAFIQRNGGDGSTAVGITSDASGGTREGGGWDEEEGVSGCSWFDATETGGW
jgi:hypothetical protein